MAITTRAGKTSALTHDELDANFTTLGLAHGDTVANLDVSSIIVNSTLTENRPMIVEANSDSINEVAKFIRPSGSTGTRSALVTHTEFSSNATAGQGTGIWSTYRAADTGLLNMSGIQSEIRQYTSDTDYTIVLKLYTMDDNSGANLKSLIEASTDEIVFKDTQRVELQAPLKVAHYTNTEIGSLAAHDGSIIFNTDTNQFQGWDGSSWVNLGYTGTP